MRGGNLNKLNLEIKRYAKVEKVKIILFNFIIFIYLLKFKILRYNIFIRLM